MDKIAKTMLVSGMVSDIAKIILFLLVVGIVLWGLFSCQSHPNSKSNANISQTLHQTTATNTQIKEMNQNRIFGPWADDFVPGIIYRIKHKSDNNYVLETSATNSNKWQAANELKKITRNGESIYKVTEEGYSEYYRIEPNGDLSVFDNLGYIATYKVWQ